MFFLRFVFLCFFWFHPWFNQNVRCPELGLLSEFGGGVTGRKPMGSDCDHEGSLATWLWSSIDDRISSS